MLSAKADCVETAASSNFPSYINSSAMDAWSWKLESARSGESGAIERSRRLRSLDSALGSPFDCGFHLSERSAIRDRSRVRPAVAKPAVSNPFELNSGNASADGGVGAGCTPEDLEWNVLRAPPDCPINRGAGLRVREQDRPAHGECRAADPPQRQPIDRRRMDVNPERYPRRSVSRPPT